MRFHWNSRFASHLLAAVLVIMLLLLGWRISPGNAWAPSVETAPMFEEDLPPLEDVLSAPEPNEPVALLGGALEPEPSAPAVPGPEPLPENTLGEPALAMQQTQALPERAQRESGRDMEAEWLYADWARARQLLRQRDLAGAELAYQDLARRWQNHPDLAGELGNVYLLLGEEGSARAAFQRAKELLEPMGPSFRLRAVTRWLNSHPQT